VLHQPGKGLRLEFGDQLLRVLAGSQFKGFHSFQQLCPKL
jgi:hypothetical protein